MFTVEDFRIDNAAEFVQFLPIFIFIALCSPYLIAAYSLGFAMDVVNWLD